MKFKKIIAVILSAAMLLTISGCTGDSGDPGTSQTNSNQTAVGNADSKFNMEHTNIPGVDFDAPPVQLIVYSQLANYSGKLTGWFAEVMRREFNVEMTIIPQPEDGIFDTRMETGNLGDIVVFGNNASQYNRAVREGMLFDWNEDDILSDYGSYIKENMPYAIEHNAELNQSITGVKTVHGFGHDVATSSEEHVAFFYSWDARWDLYKELGYPQVKDLDDLFQLFISMKEIYPKDKNGNETYAVSLWPDWDGNIVMNVKAFATGYYGHDELGFGLYNVETGEYYHALEIDGPYHESLKFFNRLYQAGLLDPNSMTQTFEDMGQKVLAGGAFFSMFTLTGRDMFNTEQNKSAGEYMYTVVPDDATPLTYAMSVKGGERVWAIGANTEYPELCMAIINWLTTPEGCMTYHNGPKDLCWYYDEDGFTYYTELGESAKIDRRNTIMPDEWGGGDFNAGTFQANNTTWAIDASNPDSNGETYNSTFWLSRRTGADSDIQQDWIDFNGAYDTDEFFANTRKYKVSLTPASGFLEASREGEIRIIWEQISNCIVNYSWRAIYANSDDEFDRIFEEMVQKCAEYDPGDLALEWCLDQAAIRFALEEELR